MPNATTTRSAVRTPSQFAREFMARQFALDLAACIDLNRVRKAENAAARARCQADTRLCAVLQAEADRRGEAGINWPEYFRNLDINY